MQCKSTLKRTGLQLPRKQLKFRSQTVCHRIQIALLIRRSNIHKSNILRNWTLNITGVIRLCMSPLNAQNLPFMEALFFISRESLASQEKRKNSTVTSRLHIFFTSCMEYYQWWSLRITKTLAIPQYFSLLTIFSNLFLLNLKPDLADLQTLEPILLQVHLNFFLCA